MARHQGACEAGAGGEGRQVSNHFRACPWGISYEADAKHRRLIAEYFGFDANSRRLTTNGVKDEDKDADDMELAIEEKKSFRAVAARMNFLASDCPDIQFPSKEICRSMSNPTEKSFQKLKRAARYLLSREAVKFKYEWQEDGVQLKVYTDSDWAGCLRTRKSTSGGVIMLGRHCIKTWSLTQSSIALSSAEAEYYAMVEGATRAIGARTMLDEIGVKVNLTLATDSSAAKSLGSRRGTGKIRHLATKWLWLQAEVANGSIRLVKVPGEKNPADVLTKYKSRSEIARSSNEMSIDLNYA